MARSGISEFLGLLFTTLVLVVALDGIVSDAFTWALTDPAFARSSAAPIWRLLQAVFALHMDVLGMWLAVIGSARR